LIVSVLTGGLSWQPLLFLAGTADERFALYQRAAYLTVQTLLSAPLRRLMIIGPGNSIEHKSWTVIVEK
jgi:hypothetical protein